MARKEGGPSLGQVVVSMLSAFYNPLTSGPSLTGSPVELVASEKQPDASEFFKRHKDKCTTTISTQGTNEDTPRKLSRHLSSSLVASFTAP